MQKNILKLNAPIYSALKDYADENNIPFHMPGHKMGIGFPKNFAKNLPKFDITELPNMDNLHFPDGIIKEAQLLAAHAFNANKTFFLVNGATCGVHAAIMTTCEHGSKIIIGRDCHRSAIEGTILANAIPVYVNTEVDNFFGISTGVEPETLKTALEDNPDASAVFVTRPNYYGICSDMEKIVDITHSFGKILIVDEAHGAHLKFNKKLPISAIDAGADICVQSAHKTLPALTQGAYLHIKSDSVDIEKLEFYLRLLETTSPSYIIMASLDMARALMEYSGKQLLDNIIKKTDWIRQCIKDFEGIVPLGKECNISNGRSKTIDQTRLVLNSKNLGITGHAIAGILKEKYRIQVEMSDIYNIICICTVADKDKYFKELNRAIHNICCNFKKDRSQNNVIMSHFGNIDKYINVPMPSRKFNPCDVKNMKGRFIELKNSVGKISRDFIVPYPPGVPIICPGEIIFDEIIKYVSALIELGSTVNGVYKSGKIFLVDIIE